MQQCRAGNAGVSLQRCKSRFCNACNAATVTFEHYFSPPSNVGSESMDRRISPFSSSKCWHNPHFVTFAISLDNVAALPNPAADAHLA